jgi:uncharacterized delta-60 repeat protein
LQKIGSVREAKMKLTYLRSTLICLFLLSVSAFSQKLNYDASFAPTINGAVNFVKILDNQKILIAGDFTVVNGVARNRIARLNPDGNLDLSFNAPGVARVNSLEVLPDGKILLSGGYIVPFPSNSVIARLNSDGTLDNTMTSFPFINEFTDINKAEQLPNGKILICGKFTTVNGISRSYIARINFNGTYDATFITTINNECRDIEAQPDGKYLVSGYYSTVNGNPKIGLTRFNADDTIDTTFNPPVNNGFNGIELLNDGSVMGFRPETSCCWSLASRLNSVGSLQANYPMRISLDKSGDVAFQQNGKLLISADFENFSSFNRYNTDGTHDPSLDQLFFSGSGSDKFPKAIEVAADGNVIIGGGFTQFSMISGATTNRPYLARFVSQAIPIKRKFDFDGDGKDDISVYRPSDRVWYLNRTNSGFFSTQFGISTDKPVVNDYDNDGKADIAVFRDGVWYWLRSSDSTFVARVCGQAGDIPSALYPGNNTLLLVFRPSTASFYHQSPFSNAQPVEFRNIQLLPTDIPVVADYDGDGRNDLAVFRGGNWFYMASTGSQTRHYQFGLAGDKPVPADYDGDGRTDFAVFRPSTGTWYVQQSTLGFFAVKWGLADDLPVPADYDGDGKTDIAVYRNGTWYQLRSNGSVQIEQFGLAGDIPAQLQ